MPVRCFATSALKQGGTHHGCSSFRPQGAGAISPILKAVHLLANHIGALTDATTKKIRRLQERRPDLTEPRTLELLPGLGLNRLPTLKRFRQQINHAPEALQLIQNPGLFTSGPVCTLTSA